MIENVEKNLVSLMQKLVGEDDEETQKQYLLSAPIQKVRYRGALDK